MLARIGLLDEAELAYREAVAAGECAETRTNLGLLLLDRGDRDGALQEFERALELDPSAPEAAVNRANVLVELGRLTEAQELYEALALTNETRAPALWGLAALADSRGDGAEATRARDEAAALWPSLGQRASTNGHAPHPGG